MLIRNVEINFPFKPYDAQICYMDKVLECLQNGLNGILESPTGTGKTLCLLCSSLAWLESKKAQLQNDRFKLKNDQLSSIEDYRRHLTVNLDNASGTWKCESRPKIIYATRTHSQINQVMTEMKKTAYRHFKTTVLGSRDRMCIHPQVEKETSHVTKINMCQAKIKKRACIYYNRVEAMKSKFEESVLTMEDMINVGTKHGACPYFVSRELQNDADITFVPYNYLLSSYMRRIHGIDVKGSIIIFDEAHNLESVCEESCSVSISSIDLALAINDVVLLSPSFIEKHGNEKEKNDNDNFKPDKYNPEKTIEDLTINDVVDLKKKMEDLENYLDKIRLTNESKSKHFDGKHIFDIFSSVGITEHNLQNILKNIELLIEFISLKNDTGKMLKTKGNGLNGFMKTIKLIFRKNNDSDDLKSYKVFIQETESTNNYNRNNNHNSTVSKIRTINFWCFSSSEAMKDLITAGTMSIILTSGTLSPLSSFQQIMGIDFKVDLKNAHVIDSHQLQISVVCKGYDLTPLNPSYRNRFCPKYQASLGNTIVNYCRHCPDALLIFFPSYSFMDMCVKSWQESEIYSRIEKIKLIYIEPRDKSVFKKVINDFYTSIKQKIKSGAIFMAVCGGNVSEGLDFSDEFGRTVILVGIPFPPRKNPRIMMKIEYLNSQKNTISGNDWYTQQAYRSANQSIGRVIRHRNDYGCILLCDDRYKSKNSQKQLPFWMQSNVVVYDSFGDSFASFINFFKAKGHGKKSLTVLKDYKRKELKENTTGCSKTINNVDKSVQECKELYSQYSGVNDESKEKKEVKSIECLESRPAKRIKIISDREKYLIPKIIDSTIYTKTVKGTLNAEEYKTFVKTVKGYHEKEDLLEVVGRLKLLFLNNPDRYSLFRDFSKFIRKHHKREFINSWLVFMQSKD